MVILNISLAPSQKMLRFHPRRSAFYDVVPVTFTSPRPSGHAQTPAQGVFKSLAKSFFCKTGLLASSDLSRLCAVWRFLFFCLQHMSFRWIHVMPCSEKRCHDKKVLLHSGSLSCDNSRSPSSCVPTHHHSSDQPYSSGWPYPSGQPYSSGKPYSSDKPSGKPFSSG